MNLPRICYFGAYDPAYPRNLILRRGLEMNGAQVVECRVSPKLDTRHRARALVDQFREVADQCDVILLAEFNQSLAPLAWWLSRRTRKRLVIDELVSIYESAVNDRGVIRRESLAARRYWLIDWLSVRLADLLLVDTAQHANYFASTLGLRRDRFRIVPVGASREWFAARSSESSVGRIRASFYGTYIPLHGIETILRAADILANRPEIRFEVIGRGQTYDEMQALATGLPLRNVEFRQPMPQADLASQIACANICLGIFGGTEKARRVIPNKVYQTLALGKAVITADTPAVREMFVPGEHLLAIPPNEPRALAEAIMTLAADASRRAILGAAGLLRMEADFGERAVGRKLLEALV